jgi:basic amino acid/polyamine antiporter, APA family
VATSHLKRRLGIGLLTLYGLGTTIGAGIYVLVGEVAGVAGLYAPLAFVLASILAGFSALSFAELSVRYPVSAGEAAYVAVGLNIRHLGLFVGLLVIAAGSVSSAAIVNGFVGYLNVFVDMPREGIIIIIAVILGAIASWGILESVVFASIITAVEIGGLVLIIAVGAPTSLEHLPALITQLPPLSADILITVMFGATLAFYAFIGFEDMINVAEEVTDVGRTMPRAIILTLIITTILYFIISLVAVTALPLAELSNSKAPLADIYQHNTGNQPYLISLIGIFAVLNGALIQIIMASRIVYGLSQQGHLPSLVGRVSAKTQTPVNATILVTAIILVLALALPLLMLAQFTSAITLTVFCLVNISLIAIKRRSDDTPSFQVPNWVPWIGAVTSGSFALVQIAGM